MSTKVYSLIAVNHGYDKLDLSLQHHMESAQQFLNSLGYTRHYYANEINNMVLTNDSDLLIYANITGIYIHNAKLALDVALNSKKASLMASMYHKLLAIAYNDQCLVDVFSYFENGQLLRHAREMDGDTPSDIIQKGEYLEEEISNIEETTRSECSNPDLLHTFSINDRSYTVEGNPFQGSSLAISRRLIDEDIIFLSPAQGSLFKPKPWWKRW